MGAPRREPISTRNSFGAGPVESPHSPWKDCGRRPRPPSASRAALSARVPGRSAQHRASPAASSQRYASKPRARLVPGRRSLRLGSGTLYGLSAATELERSGLVDSLVMLAKKGATRPHCTASSASLSNVGSPRAVDTWRRAVLVGRWWCAANGAWARRRRLTTWSSEHRAAVWRVPLVCRRRWNLPSPRCRSQPGATPGPGRWRKKTLRGRVRLARVGPPDVRLTRPADKPKSRSRSGILAF
jgi:hypothetical protein